MITDKNLNIPGVIFNHGFDITSDHLNALQQYMVNEISNRTVDLIDYPGFIWGLEIGDVSGQNITITTGVGMDQKGRRLHHKQQAAYKLTIPTGTTVGYLCVKTDVRDILFKVHPYDGTRHPVESAIGVNFFIGSSIYTDIYGNKYAPNNEGLIICKLTASGLTYSIDTSVRSPFLKTVDGL